MKHLDYVSELLESANLGSVGETIFIGTIPHDNHKAIMLRDPLTGHAVNEEIPNWYQSNFQVVIRDPDEQCGSERAEEVFKILFQNHIDNGEVCVNKMFPRTKPIMYPRSDADYIEFGMLVRIHFGENV